jgi:uncharacterized phage protein (TIGR01671 family)
MREIRFRVWDKKHKAMVYPYDAQKGDGLLLVADMAGKLYVLDECGNYMPVDTDHYEIMQYTGVKDCNGKEIYEGDIVHVTDFFHGDAKVYKGVVKFVGGYYQIEGEDIRNVPLGWIISSDDVEVIGNIYSFETADGEGGGQ